MALQLSQGLGYLGIVVLMAIESSFLPFPSEVVIPPAAYLASQGRLDLGLVIAYGVLGSLVGAIINYGLAYYLGRPLIYDLADKKWARFIMLSPDKVLRAEKYFLKNADSATFFGRLIPVIRQLVSLPAGFSRMPFLRFVLLTIAGSTLWVSVLGALGYFIGANQVLLGLYYREISAGLFILGVIWLIYKVRKTVKQKKFKEPPHSSLV